MINPIYEPSFHHVVNADVIESKVYDKGGFLERTQKYYTHNKLGCNC